jgi:hypothetical protein
MNRLVSEMVRNSRGVVGEPFHVRRSAIEIRTAMHALKLVHPYGGRPIPGDPLSVSQEEAITVVMAQVAGNRFAEGVTLDPDDVASQLDKEYFSVEPWPLSQLTA